MRRRVTADPHVYGVLTNYECDGVTVMPVRIAVGGSEEAEGVSPILSVEEASGLRFTITITADEAKGLLQRIDSMSKSPLRQPLLAEGIEDEEL